ncbi:hypothetical protein A2U01_0085418, partial [Trifolium medium]|nr:hypothetical protein [Trifolium medium]
FVGGKRVSGGVHTSPVNVHFFPVMLRI